MCHEEISRQEILPAEYRERDRLEALRLHLGWERRCGWTLKQRAAVKADVLKELRCGSKKLDALLDGRRRNEVITEIAQALLATGKIVRDTQGYLRPASKRELRVLCCPRNRTRGRRGFCAAVSRRCARSEAGPMNRQRARRLG